MSDVRSTNRDYAVGVGLQWEFVMAARATSFIRPDIVIPCHYGSEVGQLADIDELGRAVKFLSSSTNVAALASG